MTVSLDGSGSSDLEGSIVSYSWDYGDGSPLGSGITSSHIYNTPGTYTVTLTVSDGSLTGSATTTITVTAPNTAPTASFTATPTSGEAPLTVSLDGSGSSDLEGSIVSYSWDYGDGSPLGSGVTSSHIYNTPGTYTVTLTVSDGSLTGSATTINGYRTK